MTYFHATRRRVKQCPRCRALLPAWHSTNFHKHGHSNVAMVPSIVWIVNPGIEDEQVEEAVGWLEAEWNGEPYVPDDLLPTVSV